MSEENVTATPVERSNSPPISSSDKVQYSASDKPVFLGHYWMSGQPALLADNIACVDYSVANPGGKLVAYRWDGEATLDSAKFILVERLEQSAP